MRYLPYLLLICFGFNIEPKTILPTQTKTHTSNIYPKSKIPFKNYLGINLFEWDYVAPNQQAIISETKMQMISAFGGIRHYLDWERIEPKEGRFTFNPSHEGGWFFDEMYQRTKAAGMDILVCLKTVPPWLLNTYPPNERDYENVPMAYGADKTNPASYLLQARAAFQFAARYGNNQQINPQMLLVNTNLRWPDDVANTKKVGMNLVKYIECDNERDKWWKGQQAEQSAEEYAANLSAFYDGHKGKLGKDVGVKNADPQMKVVMAGLAVPDTTYVAKMIEWCRKYRGFKKDGSVDLCFDVLNYHIYPNNALDPTKRGPTQSVAPELSLIGKVADNFKALAKNQAQNMDVWVTETGYDVGKTNQAAIAIGEKTSYITQADWNLRTALLYARHQINKSMFYMLDDVDLNSQTQFSSSGFWNADFTARPSLNYIRQAKKLIGDFYYIKTLSHDPSVDLYKNGNKEIYVLTVPDQKNRKARFTLSLGQNSKAVIHYLQADKANSIAEPATIKNGKLEITVTETPVFIEKI